MNIHESVRSAFKTATGNVGARVCLTIADHGLWERAGVRAAPPGGTSSHRWRVPAGGSEATPFAMSDVSRLVLDTRTPAVRKSRWLAVNPGQ
jgi:hypothetical protein